MCGSEIFNLMPVRAVVPMAWHAFNAHSGAHMLRVDSSWIDPFIGIDSYTVTAPTFGPHPHAGMSAVSLMLPESEGGFTNRDTMGDQSLIHPGDLHWFQAGRGAMHEEEPVQAGVPVRGLQVFVNLSRENKHSEPISFKVGHVDMPCVSVDGGTVRVVAGEFANHSSPIVREPKWLTRVNMLDISLAPEASVNIPVRAGDNAFFVIRSGHFRDSTGADIAQSAIIFEAFSETTKSVPDVQARIQAGSQALRGVFFSGTPLGEPVVAGGPFVGNSLQDIRAWREAFARGEMGHLAPSFSSFR